MSLDIVRKTEGHLHRIQLYVPGHTDSHVKKIYKCLINPAMTEIGLINQRENVKLVCVKETKI